MGTTPSETASYTQKDADGGTSGHAPYFSAIAEGESAGSIGASPVLPAATSSILSQPGTSTQIVRFKKRPAAAVLLRHDRPQAVLIYAVEGAVCIDQAAQHLMFCYILEW